MRRRQFFRALLGLAALPFGVASVSKSLPAASADRSSKVMAFVGLDHLEGETVKVWSTRRVKKVHEFSFEFDEDFYAGDWIEKLDKAVIR